MFGMQHADTHNQNGRGPGRYLRFCLMILTSMVVMYLLTYLTTYAFDHVYFSETRAYMTLIMGGAMAVVMLLFMWKMYRQRAINIAVLALAATASAAALGLMRSQATIDDVSWMKAMIPHHSIAILTSERANISDPRVRRLADDIIEAQRREIGQMQELIRELEQRP